MSIDSRQLWGKVQDLLPVEFGPVGEDAVSFVRTILDQFPDSSSVKVLLADVMMFADDPSGVLMDEAAKLLADVVKNDPFCASAYGALASLNSMRDLDEVAASNALFAMELSCTIESAVSSIEYGIDSDPVAKISPDAVSSVAELFEKLVFRIRRIERALGLSIVDGDASLGQS